MTTQELREELDEKKIAYSRIKMAHNISPLENPVSLKYTRKDVARMSTELRHREINGEAKS